MQTANTIFSQPDIIEILIEESMPWFMGWCFAITIVLFAFLICDGVSRMVRRSPVDKLLRRRFG
jgi:hypothetical protein